MSPTNCRTCAAHRWDRPLSRPRTGHFGRIEVVVPVGLRLRRARAGHLRPRAAAGQQRRDYELNTNDSAWLANAKAPITGYPRIVGDIGTAARRGPGRRCSPSRGRVQTDSMQRMLFGGHSMFAELAAADMASVPRSPAGRRRRHPARSVRTACSAIASWDHRYTVDSGVRCCSSGSRSAGYVGTLLEHFDPKAPVTAEHAGHRERGRTEGSATRRPSFARRYPAGREAGRRPGGTRKGERIPIQAAGLLGVLNVLTPVWDPERGNVEV